MQRLFLLFVFMLVLLPVSYAEEPDEPQWRAFGRISTPQAIWQRLIEIEELKPVYEACRDDFANLFPSDFYSVPPGAGIDKTFYVAIGKSKKRETSDYFVWVNEADNKTLFLGTFPSYYSFIYTSYRPDRSYYYRNNEDGTPFNMPIPPALLDLDNKSMVHIKFLKDSLLQEVKFDLENELSKEDKLSEMTCRKQAHKLTRLIRAGSSDPEAVEKIACPLGGAYNLDSSGKKYVCNHVVKALDYRKTPLQGPALEALTLIESLEKLSGVELKIMPDSAALNVEVSWNDTAVNSDKNLFEALPEFRWINNIHNYDRLSPVESMHLALDIDWISFLAKIREYEPSYDLLGGKLPAELLPEGVMLLSTSGTFDPFTRRLPQATLSLGMTAAKMSNCKALLQGAPLRFSEYELHGRDVEAFEIPELGHAFNSNSDTDNRIFVVPGNNDRVKLCFGEIAARRQIELECGETKAVSLWRDIDVPVKFAMAFRADACARALLKSANEMRFVTETRVCLDKIDKWRSANPKVAEQIKESRVIPEDLKKCCNREGIMLDVRYGYVGCSVHKFHNSSSIEDQFYAANISSDRWLRIYVRQGNGRSSLIVDLTKAAEVK
ncbi:MAG: hypothetical protein CVV41_21315 [Candidatus Riflebacteria bacterium HGW-Riflebacteria-1]|nr:MAG: hypothetical protein CVV41_21315 [Candidatus Riflebacteria bacterium HGW-Riflebacteria-1]